ncbi:sister chromatid cohesion 1 protein 2-like isoform X2 [Typha angustifolia]|uniref:sister chromatid cohesion 1 protein 2-like isoform X2 n=1 Tax=Typha angustifolia TaxID=59011 RepID=UPI003C2F1E41
MFYSHSLLSRNGPLGTIWVAAYCFKKLKKEQIADTDISSSIDKIMPEIQISYRIMAQLLLGIVRIFSKKVDFLYNDCNEALAYIGRSFVPRQRTVSKGTTRRSHYKVKHAPQKDSLPREVTPLALIEAMRAQTDHVTIEVPRTFELDSFDLEIPDELDTAEPHEHAALQDSWVDERDQTFLSNEYYHRERFAHAEFNSVCFTPVDNAFLSDAMDIDLEISEPYTNRLVVKREKLRAKFQNLDVHGAHESIGAQETVDGESANLVHLEKLNKTPFPGVTEKEFEQKEQSGTVSLHKELSSNDEKSGTLLVEISEATTPTKTLDKSHPASDSGLVSPNFVVRTPAKREPPLRLRKRKNFYDESIVLSNETLRQGIHDASNLVLKRRKAPHTSLDAWKEKRITYIKQTLMDPLITCMSSDLQALFRNIVSDYSAAEIFLSRGVQSDNVQQNSGLDKSADLNESFQEKVAEALAPETYLIDKANKLHEATSMEASDAALNFLDIVRVLFSFFSPSLHLVSFRCNLLAVVVNHNITANFGKYCVQDLVSHEGIVVDQGSEWPVRTRAVAQYLQNRFLNFKDEDQNRFLSLSQILEGKPKGICARFFFETLVLKGYDFIDVQQDLPYDDITISATPRLESQFTKTR